MYKDTSIKEFKGTKSELHTVETVYRSLNSEICAVIEYDKTISVGDSDKSNTQFLEAIERIGHNSPKIIELRISPNESGSERIEKFFDGFQLDHEQYCFASFQITVTLEKHGSLEVSQVPISLTYQNKNDKWIATDGPRIFDFIYDLKSATDPTSPYLHLYPAGYLSFISATPNWMYPIKIRISHFRFMRKP